MKEYFGKALSSGIAKGRIYIYSHNKCFVRRYHIENSQAEIERFEKARTQAKAELERLFEKTVIELGEFDAGLFSTQIDFLENNLLTENVYDIITDQMVNAEVAVAQACEMLVQEPEPYDDYFRSRFYEINDACERIIRILLGIQMNEFVVSEPVIVVAKKLEPSDIVRFDNDKILGIALESDEPSRIRSLARSKALPMLTGIEGLTVNVKNGEMAVLDAEKGVLTII